MNMLDAQNLALELMAQHGLLNNGQNPWMFGWMRKTRVFGECDYTNRRITLSRPLVELNDVAHVRNTILHEIAHALTPGMGHGLIWKLQARAMGCSSERCAADDTIVPGKFKATCPKCGMVHYKMRMPKRTLVCAPCWRGTYDRNLILNFERTN